MLSSNDVLEFSEMEGKVKELEAKYKIALEALEQAMKASFRHTKSGTILFEAYEKLTAPTAKPKREDAL